MIRYIGIGSLGILLAGCYTLQPAGGFRPELVGTEVAFDVNDAGRVALGGAMGPEIAQVEGRLIQKDDSDYVLAASGVRLLRGGVQKWAGETVRINTSYVSTIYERRLSVGRSVVLGLLGAGAVAYLVTRSLVGSGTIDMPPDPGPPAPSQRYPRLCCR